MTGIVRHFNSQADAAETGVLSILRERDFDPRCNNRALSLSPLSHNTPNDSNNNGENGQRLLMAPIREKGRGNYFVGLLLQRVMKLYKPQKTKSQQRTPPGNVDINAQHVCLKPVRALHPVSRKSNQEFFFASRISSIFFLLRARRGRSEQIPEERGRGREQPPSSS